jgi:hypothetical protein
MDRRRAHDTGINSRRTYHASHGAAEKDPPFARMCTYVCVARARVCVCVRSCVRASARSSMRYRAEVCRECYLLLLARSFLADLSSVAFRADDRAGVTRVGERERERERERVASSIDR